MKQYRRCIIVSVLLESNAITWKLMRVRTTTVARAAKILSKAERKLPDFPNDLCAAFSRRKMWFVNQLTVSCQPGLLPVTSCFKLVGKTLKNRQVLLQIYIIIVFYSKWAHVSYNIFIIFSFCEANSPPAIIDRNTNEMNWLLENLVTACDRISREKWIRISRRRKYNCEKVRLAYPDGLEWRGLVKLKTKCTKLTEKIEFTMWRMCVEHW